MYSDRLFLFYHFRIEKELKKIERDNRIPRRWLPEAREYQHALSIFEDQKKTNLLVSARSQATERIFHLNLKKKYSGKGMWILISLPLLLEVKGTN